LRTQASQLAHFTAESHKLFEQEHLLCSNNFQMPLLLQQMLRLAVFTSTEFRLLCTLMHRQTTKIIYTVLAAQPELEKLVR
jgi:hypothetical protein